MFVSRSQEEHVHAFDESARVVVDRVPDHALLDTIRQTTGIELVLPAAVAIMVKMSHIPEPPGHAAVSIDGLRRRG
jgi:hypothetical protein